MNVIGSSAAVYRLREQSHHIAHQTRFFIAAFFVRPKFDFICDEWNNACFRPRPTQVMISSLNIGLSL